MECHPSILRQQSEVSRIVFTINTGGIDQINRRMPKGPMFTLPGQRDMAVGCGPIELMPRQTGEKQIELVSGTAIAGFYPQDGSEIFLHTLIHPDVGIINRLSNVLRGDKFCPAIF